MALNEPSCYQHREAKMYQEEFDLVCEYLFESVLIDLPPGIDRSWLAEDLASRFNKTRWVSEALLAEAQYWDGLRKTRST